MAVEAS